MDMQRTYGNRITTVKIPKSGGVYAMNNVFLFLWLYLHGPSDHASTWTVSLNRR